MVRRMVRKIQARDLLIIGDSDVRRKLWRAGLLYTQSSECVVAHDITEFTEAVKLLEPNKHKIVIFAMMTNIIVSAGSNGTDHVSRIKAIDDCLDSLFKDIRYFLCFNPCLPLLDLSFSYEAFTSYS